MTVMFLQRIQKIGHSGDVFIPTVRKSIGHEFCVVVLLVTAIFGIFFFLTNILLENLKQP